MGTFWSHFFKGHTYTATAQGGCVLVAREGFPLGSFASQLVWETWLANLPQGKGALPGTARISSICYEIIRVAALDYAAAQIPLKRLYSTAERAETLERYFASGLTRAEFAQLEGVPSGTLGRWATQARKAEGQARRSPRRAA